MAKEQNGRPSHRATSVSSWRSLIHWSAMICPCAPNFVGVPASSSWMSGKLWPKSSTSGRKSLNSPSSPSVVHLGAKRHEALEVLTLAGCAIFDQSFKNICLGLKCASRVSRFRPSEATKAKRASEVWKHMQRCPGYPHPNVIQYFEALQLPNNRGGEEADTSIGLASPALLFSKCSRAWVLDYQHELDWIGNYLELLASFCLLTPITRPSILRRRCGHDGVGRWWQPVRNPLQ